MFTPKSYSIRHKILVFLRSERFKFDPKYPNSDDFSFTIKEISDGINHKESLIDEQIDVLYRTKEVYEKTYDDRENKYYISEIGLYSVGKKEILNEGMSVRSNIFNNLTASVTQIIITLIAMFTIYMNIKTTSKNFDLMQLQIDKQQDNINQLESSIKELQQYYKQYQTKKDTISFSQ
ncbi:hypothetical protein [Carboxylicivirga caseinilyticus]|uniref:hypothetical protein n=1 Tax=Carboxylicivirga caseinilyticus TaxID=3417572 RepID=UPI003D35168A|nr:hypothetical protein [Marinilabiliaceae bacterium A049]